MDLSTAAYRYNQNMMEYYTCKLNSHACRSLYFVHWCAHHLRKSPRKRYWTIRYTCGNERADKGFSLARRHTWVLVWNKNVATHSLIGNRSRELIRRLRLTCEPAISVCERLDSVIARIGFRKFDRPG